MASQISIIKQYEDLAMRKMGEICGHIPDFFNKIKKMDECIQAGIMSAILTPKISLGRGDRTLMGEAIKYGYTELCRYLASTGEKLPAAIP